MISLPGQRPLYICDEEPVIEEEITEGSTDETTEETDETTEETEGSTDETEGPTWPGGLKECPSNPGSYQTNDYVFSSL